MQSAQSILLQAVLLQCLMMPQQVLSFVLLNFCQKQVDDEGFSCPAWCIKENVSSHLSLDSSQNGIVNLSLIRCQEGFILGRKSSQFLDLIVCFPQHLVTQMIAVLIPLRTGQAQHPQCFAIHGQTQVLKTYQHLVENLFREG